MKRKLKISGAVILGLLVLLVIIGLIVGPTKQQHRGAAEAAKPAAPKPKPAPKATPKPTATTRSTTTATSTATRQVAAKPVPGSGCVGGTYESGGGRYPYGGIGASVAAFKNENPSAANPPPSSYQPGIAFFSIEGKAHGCVTEYSITMSTIPAQSARDLLTLTAGIDLPSDAKQVVDKSRCWAWRSALVRNATGKPYITSFVDVVPQGEATGHVDVQITAGPEC